MKKSIQNAGFIINEEKYVWRPSQTLIWLGIRIKLKKKWLLLYTNRKTTVQYNIRYTTPCELGKARGKLISMKFGLEDIVQLKTRNLLKINDYGTPE